MDKWSCILQSRFGTYHCCLWKAGARPEAKAESSWAKGRDRRAGLKGRKRCQAALCAASGSSVASVPTAFLPLCRWHRQKVYGIETSTLNSVASRSHQDSMSYQGCPLTREMLGITRPVILKNSFELWSLHSFGKWATGRLEKALLTSVAVYWTWS